MSQLSRRQVITGATSLGIGSIAFTLIASEDADAAVTLGELSVDGDESTLPDAPAAIMISVTGEYDIQAASTPEQVKHIMQLHIDGVADDVTETADFDQSSGSFSLESDLYEHRDVSRGDLMPTTAGGSNTVDIHATNTKTSADRAITQPEFEALYAGACQIEPLLDLEARFLLIAAGRLGLRKGEIRHMKPHWIDFDEEIIHIPEHDPCDVGKHGGICGACRAQARQMAEHNDAPIDEIKDLYWKAKTIRAARGVPYSFSDRAKYIIPEYFDEFDKVTLATDAFRHDFEIGSYVVA